MNPKKKSNFRILSGLFISAGLFLLTVASPAEPGVPNVLKLRVEGAITPAVSGKIEQAIRQAEKEEAAALILSLDTPGGLVSSMDQIVRSILGSQVPVLTYVNPPGAACGSAGVFILQASHIAAMSPATNLGSATPVSMGGGGSSPESGGEKQPDEIPEEAGANDQVNLKRKVMEHSKAQIRSLAEYRGRNATFAVETITKAKNITSNEALAINAIDLIAKDEQELLKKINGRTVKMQTTTKILQLGGANITEIESDFRDNILALIANPTVSYLLLMAGMLGIMGEIRFPGAIFPGVLGAICLIIGLYGMQTLSVDYTGIALIITGVVLFVLEFSVTSYGLLSAAGALCLVLGSVMISRSGDEFVRLSLSTALSASLSFSVIAGILAYSAAGVLRRKPVSGNEGMIGITGEALSDIDESGGRVYVHSEYWSAKTQSGTVEKGKEIKVIKRDGNVLMIEEK